MPLNQSLLITALWFFFLFCIEEIFDLFLLYRERFVFRKEIAQARAANSQRAGELAVHPSRWVRMECAKNPNTPSSSLLELAGAFPIEVLENPIFPMLLMERPDFATAINSSFWVDTRLPRELILMAIQHPSERVLSAVSSNLSLTTAEKALLAKRLTHRARYPLLDQLGFLEVLLFSLSKEEKLRAFVAHLPECVLYKRLSQDPNPGVRRHVVSNPWVLRNKKLLLRLAQDPDINVRCAVVSRAPWRLPLSLFLQDPSWEVRVELARCREYGKTQSPEIIAILWALVSDPDCRVRYSLFGRHPDHTPPQIREQLASDPCVMKRQQSTETCEQCPMRVR
jgi:hypothetical protein